MKVINFIVISYVFEFLCYGNAIQYQTGTFDLLSNNGCNQQKTIFFKEQFDNIPQVVAFVVQYDFDPNSGPTYYHSGITKTKFDVTFMCINPGIASIILEWIAVDDNRFEFISSFNNDVSNDLSKTFILPHSDPNHIQYFFGLINFNYNSPQTIDFNLDVQITSTVVTITFTQTSYALLSLGIYVVLGTADAFSLGPSTTLTDVTVNNQDVFTNLPILYNSQLIIAYKAMTYQDPGYLTTLRIKTIQQPNTNSTISYTVTTWYYLILQSIKFQEIIMFTNNQILQPTLLYKKMRVAKKYKFPNDIYPVKLSVLEINKVITNSEQFTLDPSQQWSTMIFSIQCRLSTYVVGQINKCLGCIDQFLNFKQQCYSSINLMEFYVTLYQQEHIESKFQVDIQLNLIQGAEILTTIKLTHLVQNTVGDVPYELITISLKEV